jgi:ubiquinone/menaquinone biosynthesis C-methylase UbiE
VRGVEQIPWLYDALCTVADRLGLARWRRWVAQGARGRTLEVGCGTGRNLPLYGPGARVVGLDPSLDALRRARRRAPRTPLVAATVEALPLRDGAVDTIVSSLVFCSVPDASGGLAEVRRVLAAGGQLRMLEHVRSTRPWKARWQDRLQPLWTRISGGCHPNRDTEGRVQDAGFVIAPGERRARGELRRFVARPAGSGDSET